MDLRTVLEIKAKENHHISIPVDSLNSDIFQSGKNNNIIVETDVKKEVERKSSALAFIN